MSNKLHNLAKRREFLIAEAAAQRLLLAQHIEDWRAPLVLADRGLAALSYIKNHPVSVASAGIGLFTAAGSSRVGKWFQRGWLAWQIVRKLRA
jgi:hypothetical protein